MSTIEQIEQAIQGLSAEELLQFRAWFAEYDQASRDAELADRAEKVRSSIKRYERGEARDGFQALDEMKQNISDRSQA